MGAALYIALERKMPGVDTMIDGKMLSQAENELARLAHRLGVRPLMEFFSPSADEASELLGDDLGGIEIPKAEWFSAADGLRTVDALLSEMDSSPETRAAKDDLLGFQRVLREAQKQGVRWRLAMDF